jgi:hypothetical protein
MLGNQQKHVILLIQGVKNMNTKPESVLFDKDKLSAEEIEQLKAYGLKQIENDDNALINYAFHRLLTDFIHTKEQDISTMIDFLPKDKRDSYRKELEEIDDMTK